MRSTPQIRKEFLDFFQKKQHTFIPSSSLLPSSPGLLFTNSGMNAFVPYFLDKEIPPYQPPRATNSQKCLRAGGKHNDLEDVGFDSYHHTFFEMLGNWSFGDYFKEEAIRFAWELLVEKWHFPPERLYVTYYSPAKGEFGEADIESQAIWNRIFLSVGLSPRKYVLPMSAKENFWMMGNTGPCGPCSEIHMDLTEKGDSLGNLVNQDSPLCIEIWNLVFMQYHINEKREFSPLKNFHVDTGMGLERLASVIQCTENFQHFSNPISNYRTDLFAPLLKHLESISGHSYTDCYAGGDSIHKKDNASRIIVDHIRALAFCIADEIFPGKNEKNYVVRRILRRAIRAGKEIGIENTPFLSSFLPALSESLGEFFPELRREEISIQEILSQEEEMFSKTLNRGFVKFQKVIQQCGETFPAKDAFELYDTYGFPIDLTSLMCREHHISLEEKEVERLMEEQRKRGKESFKTTKIEVSEIKTHTRTEFCGLVKEEISSVITEIHPFSDRCLIITGETPFYAEKGGQIADSGKIRLGEEEIEIKGVIQIQHARGFLLEDLPSGMKEGKEICLMVDKQRRKRISSHHTASHILHWALRDELGGQVSQKGSFVGSEYLRFDFNSSSLLPKILQSLISKVQRKIEADDSVSWNLFPYSEIEGRKEILQFFEGVYDETVRVVQIGGTKKALDGYSMELCGGTHIQKTGELGFFVIKGEKSVASGIRRIEACCGEASIEYLKEKCAESEISLKLLFEKLDQLNLQIKKMKAPISLERISLPLKLSVSEGESLNAQGKKWHSYEERISQTLKKGEMEIRRGEKAIQKLKESSQKERISQIIEEKQLLKEDFILLGKGESSVLSEWVKEMKKQKFSKLAIFLFLKEEIHLSICSSNPSKNASEILKEVFGETEGKGGGNNQIARGKVGMSKDSYQKIMENLRKLQIDKVVQEEGFEPPTNWV